MAICLIAGFAGEGEIVAQTPTWSWALGTQDSGEDFVYDVHYEGGDFLVVGGQFENALNFGGKSLSSAGGSANGFLSKFDTLGNALFHYQMSSTDPVAVKWVKSDAAGNIYFFGEFSGTLTVPDDTNNTAFSSIPSEGGVDLFYGKMQSNSTIEFVRTIGSPDDDRAGGLDLIGGDLVLAGSFKNTVEVAKSTGGLSGISYSSSGGTEDAFIARMSGTNGSVVFFNQLSCPENVWATDVVTQGTEVYVVGTYEDDDLILPSSNIASVTLNNIGAEDLFVARYDDAGDLEWANRMGTNSGDDQVSGSVAVDNQNVYITGRFESANFRIYDSTVTNTNVILFNSGNQQQFVAALDRFNGDGKWGQLLVESNNEFEGDVCSNGAGDIFVSGVWNGTKDIAGQGLVNSQGGNETFIACIYQNSVVKWVKTLQDGQNQRITNLTTDGNLLFAGGELEANTDFDAITVPFAGGNIDGFAGRIEGFICTAPPVSIGPDTSLCAGDSILLTAFAPGPGTWTSLTGNGSFSQPNQISSQYLNSTPGLDTVIFEYIGGVCYLSDTAVITVGSPVTAQLSSPFDTLCLNDTLILPGIPFAGATSLWSTSPANGVIIDPADPNSGYYAINGSFQTLTYTVTNGICTNSINYPLMVMPPSPNPAGVDSTLCQDSLLLYADQPFGYTASWEVISGNIVIADTSDPQSFASNVGPDSSVVTYTIDNGICSLTDTLTLRTTLNLNATLVLPFSADTFMCETDTFTTYAAPAPANATGFWSLVNPQPGDSLFAPNSPVSQYLPGDTLLDRLLWTVTDGFCTSSDTLRLTVFESISALTGPDTAICDTSLLLNGQIVPALGTASAGWDLIFGPGSFIAGPGPTPNAVIQADSNVFRFVASNGACSDTAIQTIYRDLPPDTLGAGLDQKVCIGDSAFLKAASLTNGSGIWRMLTPGYTLVNANSPTAIVIGFTGADTVQLEWVVFSGVCDTLRDTLEIIAYESPQVDAGPDQRLCLIDSTVLNGVVNPTTSSLLWSQISSGGAVVFSTSDTTTVNQIPVGSSTYVLTADNNGCAASDTVIVQRDSIPNAANAGPDLSVCQGDSLSLQGSLAVGFSGKWSSLSGIPAFTDTLNPSTFVSGFPATGLDTLVWTVSNGFCLDTDSVVIQVDSLYLADAGMDQRDCDSLYQLDGLPNQPGLVYQWSVIGAGSGSFSNTNISNPIFSGIPAGTQESLEFSVTNGACTDTDTVNIQRDQPPFPVNAGSDVSICEGDNLVLSASSLTIGMGMWSSSNPGIAFVNANDPQTTASNFSTSGTDTLFWTASLTNGLCAETDTVLVMIDELIPAVAGADTTICDSTFQLNGGPAGYAYTWAVLPPSAANISDPGIINPFASNLDGPTEIELTVQNGACTDADTITITANIPPEIVNAGPDQFLCEEFSTMLSGSDRDGYPFYAWSVMSGSGLTPVDSMGLVTGMSTGVNEFVWAVGFGPTCLAADTVRIEVSALPVGIVSAGTDSTYCDPDTVYLNASPNFTGGIGTWNLISGSGTIAIPSQANTVIVPPITGPLSAEWSVTNGSCVVRDTVNIGIDLLTTTANAGRDSALCDTDDYILNAVANPTGVNGTWSVLVGGALVSNINDPGALVSNLQIGENVFLWEIEEGACRDHDSVTIRVDAAPDVAFAGPDQQFCDAVEGVLGAMPVGFGTAGWTGPGIISDATVDTTSVQGLSPGQNIFVWTVSNGVCPANRDSVILEVVVSPVADAGLDQVLCDTFATRLDAGNGNGIWLPIGGPLVVADVADPESEVSDLLPGINLLAWTVDNGICSDTDSVSIEVASVQFSPDAGPDQTVYSNAAELSGNLPSSGGTVQWSIFNGTGTFADANSPQTSVTGLEDGLNIILYTGQLGPCPAIPDTLLLEVFPLTIPSGFSPNGDQVNDTWLIRGIEGVAPVRVQVFNRWGNEVYVSENYQNDWDGGTLSDDTYYYIIEMASGREENGFVIIRR